MEIQHSIEKINRRRALRTLFCSSAALSLNIVPRRAEAEGETGSVNLLAIGDFGSTSKEQRAVAEAMREYAQKRGMRTDALVLVGDNFYSRMEGGVESARWKTGFEEMYPASVFPGPAYVVLGNHDYHDNAGGEQVQLSYARSRPGTRWTLPAKWHRAELGPKEAPLATVLFLDSNLPKVSGGKDRKTGKPKASLTEAEVEEQQRWLATQLEGKRAPLTLVVGHHPLYSNGSHGDTEELIESWGGLFEKHGVHAYLCGHDHDLQHLEIEGLKTSFVLSGGGGAKVRAMKSDRKVPYANPVYGFTHLEISKAGLVFRHIGVEGRQLHAFSKGVDGTMRVEGV
jgi:tartrate-resistant acid phosphatase type 5